MHPEGQIGPERTSWPQLALLAGVGLAALSVLLAALAGPPYLSLSSLSPWLVVFAIASFGALFAVPFAVNGALVAADPTRAEAWERSMLAWGGVAIAALALGMLMIWAGGFSPASSLDDAVGLLLAIEAGMVLAVLLALMLAG
jgi:hypothetical protein